MGKQEKSIHFIMAGGTIDSYYDGTKDTVVTCKNSIIPEYISSLRLHLKTQYTQVCMKDSRDMDETDMHAIYNTIRNSKGTHFIITQGTYCMPDTARFLEVHLKNNKNKIIVFTGSFVPLDFGRYSDAPFNLGFTISEIFHLKPGIYVSMNGRIFSPGEIAKLIGQGRFVSIFGEGPEKK